MTSSNGGNWFSAASFMRVYAQYLNLDEDRDGMLSKEELKGFYNMPCKIVIVHMPKYFLAMELECCQKFL